MCVLLRNFFKNIVRNIPYFRRIEYHHLVQRGEIIHVRNILDYLNTAEEVLLPTNINLKVGLVKDLNYLNSEHYIPKRADWPKFARFLTNNKIEFDFFDIDLSNWFEIAEKFDIIIWHPYSSPIRKAEAEYKIFFIERYLKKKCFPTYDEIWSYEDKIKSYLILRHYNLPIVPTFITNSYAEARRFLENSDYPLISKLNNGSSSLGVSMLRTSREAMKYAKACFSIRGKQTYWPAVRQSNYIYFQNFIDDATYDLRIILVGNKIFGYYRYPKSGDFRASGSGLREKKDLPEEAIILAKKVKQLLKTTVLAVDMLFSKKKNKYFIIETSIFFGIDTDVQFAINKQPGYYEIVDGRIIFKKGRYWIQELALKEFFSSLGQC